MTLEEAIMHCKEKAEEIRKANEEMPTDCKLSEDLCECAEEHEQLARWLKDYKRLLEMPKGDLISREALKEHKFLSPQFKVIGGRRCGKTREQIIEAYQKGWNDCIDAIVDSAPTLSVHEIIANQSYLREFRDYGFEPISNKYEMHIDTNCLMLRCPKCKCGIIATAFSYAVGSNGYAFCPYCGADMRKGGAEE